MYNPQQHAKPIDSRGGSWSRGVLTHRGASTTCLHKEDESAAERSRRHAAVAFMTRVNLVQACRLNDAFDPCAFTLFSDGRGIIFEAHPTTLDERPPSPASGGIPVGIHHEPR